MNHHQSTAREKDGAKGPPGRGRHGASEAAQGSQAVALKGSNHEREAQGTLAACELVIIEALQLVDLRFDSRICMLPRQDLDLVPCEASGWVVHIRLFAHEVAISCPGIKNKALIHTLRFHSRATKAERRSALKNVRARSKTTENVVLWAMDKHKFLNGNQRRAQNRRPGAQLNSGGHGART